MASSNNPMLPRPPPMTAKEVQARMEALLAVLVTSLSSKVDTPDMVDRPVEGFDAYCPGGYCPINVGQRLKTDVGLFVVHHKLGFGPSSTVWLVEGKTPCCEESFHALKILRADLSQGFRHHEEEVLTLLGQANTTTPRYPHIIYYTGQFYMNSPNGRHLCFLQRPYGPSLKDLRVLQGLTYQTRLWVCEQVASALEALHNLDPTICHSAIRPEHILFELPTTPITGTASINSTLGPIRTHAMPHINLLLYSPRRPYYLIAPAEFKLPARSLHKIVLTGFGRSFIDRRPTTTAAANRAVATDNEPAAAAAAL
ncbi:hypothetical protein VTJ04DRAFT_10265 [Mycothermus thermophilus]|uniref:uncharacterized protein n=1 Tax=Humicola insolens TaxID=85995 RepID=UPI0037447CDB